MSFNRETKVKDIALSNPAARQVLEDAGLDYCCGGGKSLHEACLHTDVSAEEIVKRLHENSKNVRPNEANWLSAPHLSCARTGGDYSICHKHFRYVHSRAESRAETAPGRGDKPGTYIDFFEGGVSHER